MSETVSCLSCNRSLRVPDDLLGRNVKCPACGNTFVAEAGGGTSAPPPEPSEPEPDVRERRSERVASRDEDDRPRRSSRDDDDRPRRRVSRRDDDDDDDDDYDRPRRSRRRGKPHRGGMILALGIVSLFFMPLILGPIAWILGNSDMREIRAGRMDREGESQTNTGRILGMVSTILGIVVLVGVCLMWVFLFGLFGIAASNAPRPAPQPTPFERPAPIRGPRRIWLPVPRPAVGQVGQAPALPCRC